MSTRVASLAATTAAMAGSCSPLVSLMTLAPAAIAASATSRGDGVDRDDDVGRGGDRRDDRHDPVELLVRSLTSGPRPNGTPPMSTQSAPVRHGGQRRLDGPVEREGRAAVVERVGRAVDDRHDRDLAREVELARRRSGGASQRSSSGTDASASFVEIDGRRPRGSVRCTCSLTSHTLTFMPATTRSSATQNAMNSRAATSPR